jgi:hypothetical protein
MNKFTSVFCATLLVASPIHAQDKQQPELDTVGNSILWQSFRAGMDEKSVKQAIKLDPITKKQRLYFDRAENSYRVGVVSIMESAFLLSFEMAEVDRSRKLIAVLLSSDGSKYGASPSRDNCVAEKMALFSKIVSSMREKYQETESGDDYAEFRSGGAHIRVSFEKAPLTRPVLDAMTLSSDLLYRSYKIDSASYDLQEIHCRLSDSEASSGEFAKYLNLAAGGNAVGVVNIYYTDRIAFENRNKILRLDQEMKEKEKIKREETSKANL